MNRARLTHGGMHKQCSDVFGRGSILGCKSFDLDVAKTMVRERRSVRDCIVVIGRLCRSWIKRVCLIGTIDAGARAVRARPGHSFISAVRHMDRAIFV